MEYLFDGIDDKIYNKWGNEYINLRMENEIEEIYTLLIGEGVVVGTKESFEELISNAPISTFRECMEKFIETEVKEGQIFVMKAIGGLLRLDI